jgi:hypothetical protein
MRPEKQEVKKPYGKPELLVYGDLLQITQGVGGSGVRDSTGSNRKTGP